MIEACVQFKPQGSPSFEKRRIFFALPRLGETIILNTPGVMNGGRYTVTEIDWQPNGEPHVIATDSRQALAGRPSDRT